MKDRSRELQKRKPAWSRAAACGNRIEDRRNMDRAGSQLTIACAYNYGGGL